MSKRNELTASLEVIFGGVALVATSALVAVAAVALAPVALLVVGCYLGCWAVWSQIVESDRQVLRSAVAWLLAPPPWATVKATASGPELVAAAEAAGLIDAPRGTPQWERQIIRASMGLTVYPCGVLPRVPVGTLANGDEVGASDDSRLLEPFYGANEQGAAILSDDEIRQREANPLAGLPIWDDEPETVEAFATVAVVNLVRQLEGDGEVILDMADVLSLDTMPGGSFTPDDFEPVALPLPVPMPAAAQRTVADEVEIDWDAPIPYEVAEWAVVDLDAPISYTLPTDALTPMDKALALVAGGKAVKTAAREAGVSESTLRRRLKRQAA